MDIGKVQLAYQIQDEMTKKDYPKHWRAFIQDEEDTAEFINGDIDEVEYRKRLHTYFNRDKN